MAGTRIPHTGIPGSPSRTTTGRGSRDEGGLASGPRDTVNGAIGETPTEPMERPGTESAEEAGRAGVEEDACAGPRLTPQSRSGEDVSGEVKAGRTGAAEG